MAHVNLNIIAQISEALKKLHLEFAFVGGTIVGFLLDNPSLVRLRATDDVDAIANVVTFLEYVDLEKRLRDNGFVNDASENAPICRWIFEGSKVDVMPVKDHTGGMNDEWFKYALDTSTVKTLQNVSVKTISATCFIATKLSAFYGRGQNDYYGSHDLEDIITVINGREEFLEELKREDLALRTFVSERVQDLIGRQAFIDALPGHLESDMASQQRLPGLLRRLTEIATLSDENSRNI